MATRTKETIELENINEGVGNTRMAIEKYEIYKKAILAAVPRTQKGIPFKDLPAAVEKRLPKAKRAELGSCTWHTTSVKLDLEAKGLIERIPGAKPQTLRRL